jgi:uncharacterized protein (DUF302 family)
MIFQVTSNKSLEAIDQNLRASAARHKFGIITVHDLKDTLQKKGVEFSSDCLVYEVCNPHQAKKVLEADGAISTFLPCRISVYRSGDKYKLATMRPTEIVKHFPNPELAPVAQEVEAVLVDMMQSAT